MLRTRHCVRRQAILAAAMAALFTPAPAPAQGGRAWVDPPRPGESPTPAAPSAPGTVQPEAPAPAQPRRVDVLPPASGPAAEPGPAGAPVPGVSRPNTAAQPEPPGPRPRQEDAAAPPPKTPDAPAADARGPRGQPHTPSPSAGASQHARAAEEFTVTYLDYWSGADRAALDAAPDFYAPQVIFHGRQMSARALVAEKRRFFRRWPERDYRVLPDTMRVTCDPAPPVCTVRTTFAFTASNPRSRRLSQGTALLQLGVSFASGHPVIVFENSQVISRRRNGGSDMLDARDDEPN
jgi:hypothetical protein